MNTRHALIIAALALGTWGAARAEEAKPAAPAYPLDTCVVSGEKLGSMGDAYVLEHKGQQVQLCCKSCLKKFNKDPDAYVAKIAAAAKAKAAPTPAATK
jgi:YHS domain-containing protein